ncbi:unnamed protein product, partial [Phaeothamnion confervicola]
RAGGASSPAAAGLSADAPAKFRFSQKVEARYKGKGRFLPARIVGENAGGTYDVRYDDGEEERRVASNNIRVTDVTLQAKAAASPGAAAAVGPGRGRDFSPEKDRDRGRDRDRFTVGDAVEARYKGGARWFAGKVQRCNLDGTFDIRYDDGDQEKAVDAAAVRCLPGTAVAAAAGPRRLGDGRDGDRRNSSQKFGDGGGLVAGDAVQANYKGKGRWFKGIIKGRNPDSTLHVRYDDGDEEEAVEPGNVRRIGGGGGGRSTVDASEAKSSREHERDRPTAAPAFRACDEIEARYRGRSQWLRGVVRRTNGDGTYDIRYEDGENELSVDPALVRAQAAAEGRDAGSRRGDGRDDMDTEAAVAAGDAVEANFKGKGRWFKGVVKAKNREGTFHVRYDDGDEERSVEPHHVRRVGRREGGGGGDGNDRGAVRHAPADSMDSLLTPRQFSVGDAVEARFNGAPKWFSARVRRVRGNDLYDLTYDDGDQEANVPASLMREPMAKAAAMEGRCEGNGGGGRCGVEVGAAVEVNFKGKGRWFPGKVMCRHSDGTVDVCCDDGDVDDRVEARNVRLLSDRRPAAASPRGKSHGRDGRDSRDGRDGDFADGDAIEANYKGKGRWFKGVIKARNREGSFHVQYDDGDEEKAVEVGLIRRVARGSTSAGGGGAGRLVVGDAVEANYKGKGRWFKGAIKACNADGSFHVCYDDGDEERAVQRENIRR